MRIYRPFSAWRRVLMVLSVVLAGGCGGGGGTTQDSSPPPEGQVRYLTIRFVNTTGVRVTLTYRASDLTGGDVRGSVNPIASFLGGSETRTVTFTLTSAPAVFITAWFDDGEMALPGPMDTDVQITFVTGPQEVKGFSVAALGGPSGGPNTVQLPGVAEVTFPSGALPPNHPVSLEQTMSSTIENDFAFAMALLSAGPHAPSALRIKTGTRAPQGEVTVKLNVSEAFLSTLGANFEPEVLVMVYQSNEWEVHDDFRLFPSIYDFDAKTLTLVVPGGAFTNGRNPDGQFECLLLLASLPIPQPESIRPPEGMVFIDTEEGLLAQPAESSRLPAPFLVGAGQFRSSECQGAPIGPPLKRPIQVTSKFNSKPSPQERYHYGVDLYAEKNDEVIAVADGVIIDVGFDERPDPNGPKGKKGWGQYIQIKHGDGSVTVYGHLVEKSPQDKGWKVGDLVEIGETIGLADDTGGSKKDHLHLEYWKKYVWPREERIKQGVYIDPEACITEHPDDIPAEGPSPGWAYIVVHAGEGQLYFYGSNGALLKTEPANYENYVAATGPMGAYGISQSNWGFALYVWAMLESPASWRDYWGYTVLLREDYIP